MQDIFSYNRRFFMICQQKKNIDDIINENDQPKEELLAGINNWQTKSPGFKSGQENRVMRI